MKTNRSIFTVILPALVLGFNLANAQVMKTRSTGKEEITAFSATPDGKLIALGSKSTFEVINTESDVTVANLPTTMEVKSICLSQDGNLLTVSFDHLDNSRNLMYWDLKNHVRNAVSHSHKDKILCMAISSDGKLLATGSKDQTIKLFETTYFNELRTLPNVHSDDITSLKFSPDNKFLVSGSKDKSVILWDLGTNDDLSTFTGNLKKINAVAFSPDSKLIASGSDDGIIIVWDILNPQKPVSRLVGHKGAVTGIDFTPDGRFLGSSSKDKTVALWDYKRGKALELKNGFGVDQGYVVNFLSFFSDGRLYTCSGDRNLRFWNWGFPILTISNLQLEDINQNKKIDGTEINKIRFTIENTGDGNALNVKFNITDQQSAEGLMFPTNYYIDAIPARTSHQVEIRVSASSRVRNSSAKFLFKDFAMISTSPFPLKDTSFTVETVAAPYIVIDTLRFVYPDTSNALTGRQSGMFNIHLKNTGVGMAKNVKIKVSCDKPKTMLEFEEITEFGNISNAATQVLVIPVRATSKAEDDIASFRFEVSDLSSLSNPTAIYTIQTKKYMPTLLEEIREIVENEVKEWEVKSKFETTDTYIARVTRDSRENYISLVTKQTLDSLVNKELNWALASPDYDADNESFKISVPGFEPIFLNVPLDEARAFEAKFKQFKMENISNTVYNDKFAFLHLELVDSVSGNKRYYYDSQNLVAFTATQLNISFDPVYLSIPGSTATATSGNEIRRINIGRSDVDINIPEVVVSNPNLYAVIVGNEDYQKYQNDLRSEANVDYAVQDAEAFYNYLKKTYGVPEENIKIRRNATAATMNQDISWLKSIAASKKGEAELVYYYSGHGLPDENTGDGYIIPVDVTGTNLGLAIKLGYLYAELSKYSSKKVTVFLDACFSGGGRNESLLALKKVKIKPKDEAFGGNMVVFTSSSGEESSGFYREKQHGLFTYYLLKKIQETKGEVDFQSLIDYLKQEVNLKSVVANGKEQNPQLILSHDTPMKLNEVRLGSPGLEQE
ncbi:MAG: caspase family protein [Lentimicrobium sp.]